MQVLWWQWTRQCIDCWHWTLQSTWVPPSTFSSRRGRWWSAACESTFLSVCCSPLNPSHVMSSFLFVGNMFLSLSLSLSLSLPIALPLCWFFFFWFVFIFFLFLVFCSFLISFFTISVSSTFLSLHYFAVQHTMYYSWSPTRVNHLVSVYTFISISPLERFAPPTTTFSFFVAVCVFQAVSLENKVQGQDMKGIKKL